MLYDKIFAAGVIIGGTIGGYLGYKAGHKVGGFSPKRKLRKIRKLLGDGAEKARQKIKETAKKVQESA